jgi:diaminohydroxyphosphoribosylaminopyrimidine deaminase/5-amino-6-(5-phosphoribosylamino)uracil reductase
LVRTAGQYSTLVATTHAASSSKMKRLTKAKLEVLVIANDARGRVSLKALMGELARRNIVSVLLEGGPTLNASALREKLVDRLLFFLASKIVGGQKALSMIGGEGVQQIKDAEPVRILKVRRLGPDLLIEGVIAKAE